MKRLVLALPLFLFSTACAGGPPPEPPAPPPLDPVGVYDCMVAVEGMEMGVTLEITGTPGSYGGSVQSDMGTGRVTNVSIDGNEMTFVVDRVDMAVYFGVAFDGDAFTGEFDVDGATGYVSGKKR